LGIKVCIVILARNEALGIGTTIQSLFKQSIFDPRNGLTSIEIICVSNGSQDDTVKEASEALHSFAPQSTKYRVIALQIPGKANAWNHAVHQLNLEGDIYYFMDADIEIVEPDTLLNMLQVLEDHPIVIAATDLPRKDIELKKSRGIKEWFLLKIANLTKKTPGQLSGQLYCLRADFAKKIWMPTGLLVEDGFIKEMVCTELLTKPLDNAKIQLAKKASHFFNSYITIKEIFYHQVRQATGQGMYSILKKELLEKLDQNPQSNAGEIIHEEQLKDPDWFMKLIRNHASKHYWMMYPHAFSYRFNRLGVLSFSKKIAYFPLALAAFFFDIPVLLTANQRLRNLQLSTIWKNKQSHENKIK